MVSGDHIGKCISEVAQELVIFCRKAVLENRQLAGVAPFNYSSDLRPCWAGGAHTAELGSAAASVELWGLRDAETANWKIPFPPAHRAGFLWRPLSAESNRDPVANRTSFRGSQSLCHKTD